MASASATLRSALVKMASMPSIGTLHLNLNGLRQILFWVTRHNLFRIIIMNFMDPLDFDVRAVKKSCVHIVSDQYKMVPFETMNIFYRDHKIDAIREKLNMN